MPLNIAGLSGDLEDLDKLIKEKLNYLLSLHDLGNSTNSCDNLLKDTISMQNEAQKIADKCASVVQAVNEMGVETSVRAYNLLEQCSEYQNLLEHRTGMLTKASNFFQSTQAFNYQMDQLELQIRNGDKSELIKGIVMDLDANLEPIERMGMELMRENERATGVEQVLDLMRKRAENIKTMADLKQSQISR